MNKFLTLLTFLIFGLSSISSAQEICNDGIDNDGDGFIDCFDGDCANDNACDGFYLGNDASCEAEPSTFPQFLLDLGYYSQPEVTTILGRTVIGDLDRDGMPEILTSNRYRDRIYLLNGDDATIKFQATTNNPSYRANSIVNLEDDNCGEVFIVNVNGRSNYEIRAFDCQLNELWDSETLPNDPIVMSFADFDRDGQAEMYYKNEIRDPLTGVRLVARSGENWNNIPGGPVAVDILGDEDLELIIGNKIYAVNLGNRTQDAGSLTLLATMPTAYRTKGGGFGSGVESMTSVADYNLDGNLDVIVTGADGGNVSSVFFWDVANNTVKVFNDPRPGIAGYEFGWRVGMGRVNIADLDGDGQLNAAFVSGRFLYALDENWEALWVDALGNPEPTVVNEETSGITGCTLFDFNGDGQSEVVYRDEDFLYIVNGNDGSINTSIPCRSRTNIEYPIVADVDADGSTEICVVCALDTERPGTAGADLSLGEEGEVRIYKSGGEPWVPARRLWNQHAYFNVNVNNDLTIPRNQQKHQLVFSTGICTNGASRPLNSFLNQSPFLSSDGCPTYASPDLDIIESSFAISPPECPEEDFVISFDFENIGDVPLSGDVPITFYDGDPMVAGTNKLNTLFITLSDFAVGQVGSAVDIPVTGTGGPFTLYAVLNDNGSTSPAPISLPNSTFLECDYVNNIISAEVNPLPFNLVTEITPNITCSSNGVAPNGSARVYRDVGGVEVTADYDFYWFNGTTVDSTPDFVGSIYTGLAAGTYTVFASDKLVGCSSDTVQVVIPDSVRNITADITVDRPNDNCRNPNGKLTVNVNGGEPVGNFEYEWYEGNSVGGGLQISNSQIANNLESGTYTVLVTEKATGCQTILSAEVPDERQPPVVTASATDILCSDTNTGTITATAQGGNNLRYRWYIGGSVKPTPDFTDPTVTNLPQGTYTIVVFDATSKCSSDPITVEVNQTFAPEIDGVSSTENTSCDVNNPNGSVSVAFSGDVSSHSFTWFAGAGVSGTQVGTGMNVTNLGAGEYTVRVMDNTTGCFDLERVTINNNIVQPNVSATASPVTTCSPFDGSVEATVDLDDVSDYTFSWYIGTQVKASSDFSETGSVLSGLEPGSYTVQAFHNTRFCLTSPFTIEVPDSATVAIEQDLSGFIPATECDVDNGELSVVINSPNNVNGFDVDWFEGTSTSGTPFQSESGVTNSTASNLFAGLYTVVATDLDNGCSRTEVFDLPFVGAHGLDTLSTTNATTCVPFNGDVTVALTPAANTTFTDYELVIFQDNGTDYVEVERVTGQANYTFANLENGSYIIEAVADASLGGCSVYKFVTIDIEVFDPVINLASNTPNTNCDVLFANGTLVLNIDNGASPSDYNFNWYEGNDTSVPLGTNFGTTAGINGEIATDLPAGSYTVEVISNSTQCSAMRSFTVADNPVTVSVPEAEIDITPITRCDLVNSEVVINNVYENGIVANLNDYAFEWIDASGNILANNTNNISGLPEGDYTVRATNVNTGCISARVEFAINFEVNEPSISLDFTQPEQCVSPVRGELSVTATAPSASFVYQWYVGQGTTQQIDASFVSDATGQSIVNLDEGFYTVAITDIISNCTYLETYELVTQINDVNITASATPVTNCDTPNGSVFAAVTSDGSYSYSWVDASGNLVPGGDRREVDGLSPGIYTVTATDTNDNSCIATATVEVLDEIVIPPVEVVEVAPLTVCDPSLANGAARASVNGEFVGYTFEWFEGSSATGLPVYIGPEFSDMLNIEYTVRVTDNVTQCFNTASITISEEIPEVDLPTISLISNDISCIDDNGALSVDVGGNVGNFIFTWYEGDEASGSVFATGDRIFDLAPGNYTVVATDTRTGCVSLSVTAEIEEELAFPELQIETEGVTCNDDTGIAKVFVSGQVEVSRIEWYNSNGRFVGAGPVVSELTAGDYTVVVTTVQGCQTELVANVPTEINAFNGISRNGDSRNSFFKIDCITDFPNNIVKIYNRAGTLVYEARGYDNSSVFFDGVSNRGINIMGQNVPDGTYFYVIDKNNGSKPLTGYIEIVN